MRTIYKFTDGRSEHVAETLAQAAAFAAAGLLCVGHRTDWAPEDFDAIEYRVERKVTHA